MRNIFKKKDENIREEIDNNISKDVIEDNNDNASEKDSDNVQEHIGEIVSSTVDNVDLEEIFSQDIADKVSAKDEIIDKAVTKDEYLNNAVEAVIDYFTVEAPNILNSLDRGIIDKQTVKGYIETYIKSNIRSEVYGKPTEEDIAYIYDGFRKFVWGYDILEELINDLTVSDINITAYDKINLKVNGERKLSELKFRSEESYRRFVEHVAMKNRKSIADINAIRWFVDRVSNDKFILRFNISTDVVTCVNHNYISIRKIPKFKYGFKKLVELGMLSNEQVEYLVKRIKEGHSGIICGKGGSGKTILLNELIEEFPINIRMDVIQDNDELFCDTHPDIMFHRTVEPEGEAKVKYDLDILGRNGLLEDLDAFIIGEIKGKEAAHICHMAYTGHVVWCTTHAEGIYDAHYKIADYAKEITKEEPEKFMRKIKSIDTIIYMHEFKVVDIGECTGIDKEGNLLINKVNI